MEIRRFFNQYENKYRNLNREDRYRHAVAMMAGAEYQSGRENVGGSDCSGLLTLPLFLSLGVRLRITADDYFQKIFTDPRPNGIDAAFLVTPEDIPNHHGRFVRAGTVTHVMPFLAHGIVLNATWDGALIESVEKAYEPWERKGYHIQIRGINHDAAKIHSGLVYGLDKEVEEIFA